MGSFSRLEASLCLVSPLPSRAVRVPPTPTGTTLILRDWGIGMYRGLLMEKKWAPLPVGVASPHSLLALIEFAEGFCGVAVAEIGGLLEEGAGEDGVFLGVIAS